MADYFLDYLCYIHISLHPLPYWLKLSINVEEREKYLIQLHQQWRVGYQGVNLCCSYVDPK